MRAYFQLVLRYRGLVLALIVLASGAGLWGLRSAVISSSLGRLFLANSPAYEKYLDRIREFGSDEQLIIAFEEEDVLSADALRRLHSVTGRIAGIPQVATVRSILDNREVFRKTGKEGVEEVIEELASSPEKTEKARSKFLDDRFAAGIMLSADSHHGAVLITMPVEGSDSMEDTISLVDEILGIFAQQGYSPQRLHQAGGIAIVAEMMEQTHFNLERLFPMVCGLLILTVFSLFRKIWPVVISTGVAIIAVVWTMAIAVAIDPQLSIMMAAIPAVILIISFSDVIHLCSAYLLEMRETGDTTEAILRSAEDVGTACI